MKIETWPLSRIKPYEKNARKIPQRAVDKVAASLLEFGWQQPIVVDKKGVIIVGHTRWHAAGQLAWKTAPVHVADKLTPAQAKAYRIADNRTNEETSWNLDLLAPEIQSLAGMKFDLKLTGFDIAQLERFAPQQEAADPADLLEKAHELEKKWNTQRGQLWLIGAHRLVCGNCADEKDVALALGDLKPFILVTDPPYGVELDMEWRDRAGHNEMGPATKSYMKLAMGGNGISGDTKADWSEAYALVPTLEVAYVWHATSGMLEVAAGLKHIGFELRQQIVWSKTVAAMSRSAYHWKHEPCWYAVKKGVSARWVGGHQQYTVWEAASPKHIMSGSKEDKLPHPTQKPVELMCAPLRNHGQPGDVCYEPFCGSGTTMAAAQLTNRVCCAIEIEPRYCAVILERMTAMGLKPKLEKR